MMTRLIGPAALALFLATTATSVASPQGTKTHSSQGVLWKAKAHLASITMPFVPNRGQAEPAVAYHAMTLRGALGVTHDGRLLYALPSGCLAEDAEMTADSPFPSCRLSERLLGGRPKPKAGRPAATHVSLFLGNDAGRWQSGLPTCEQLLLGEVWPEIEVALEVRGHSVEKVFTLAPGARVADIRVQVDGARGLRIARDGSLLAMTDGGDVAFSAPSAWQDGASGRESVAVAYSVRGTRYGFTLGDYDPARPVVIDPILQSTYLGGSNEERGYGIAVYPHEGSPHAGEVYVTGVTWSLDFPRGTTPGYDPAQHAGRDVFVARFNPELTELLSVAILGGTGVDFPGGGGGGTPIAVHVAKVFVTGYTNSGDFPIPTAFAIQPTKAAGEDAFVAQFTADLASLDRATYLGGSGQDAGWAITGDPDPGRGFYVYVVGHTFSSEFPGTEDGFQKTYHGSGADVFVARLHYDLESLFPDSLRATYLAGSDYDRGYGVAVHPETGDVFVGGETQSTDLRAGLSDPPAAAQPELSGWSDAYVARLSPTLDACRNITYVGGTSSEQGFALGVHPETGAVFTAGVTSSGDLIPFGLAETAAQSAPGGLSDAFVARLDPELSTIQTATYLGGGGEDLAYALALSSTRDGVYVVGNTASSDFPETEGGAQDVHAGSDEVFVARLDYALSEVLQATYLGGSGQDMGFGLALSPLSRDVYVTGLTSSQDYPGTEGGAQPEHGGGQGAPIFWRDAYVARLDFGLGGGGPVVPPAVSFKRGDVNSDGAFDVSDASFSLTYQFSGGPAPTCMKTADVNDDGALDIIDPVHGLLYLFGDGPAPPAPFAACGMDPTADALGCELYAPCP